MRNTFKINWLLWYSILIVASLMIYILSMNVVWLADDLLYQFKFNGLENVVGTGITKFGAPIDDFSDVIHSQSIHYCGVNGRWVAHVLVQTFCGLLGQTPFAIINALVYVVLEMEICALTGVEIGNWKGLLSVILMIFGSFITGMSPSFQINYIWMFALVLGFLILFFKKAHVRNPFALGLLALYSFIAGEAHEGINIGVGAALIIYWAMNLRKYTLSQYVMTISFGIGGLILCLAPGNFVRLSDASHPTMVMTIVNILISLKATYILMILLVISKMRHISLRSIYKNNQFYWNVFFVCIAFSLALGVGGNRSLFGAELMAIILSVRLLRGHSFSGLWLVVFSVCLVFFWINQYRSIGAIRSQFEDVKAQYEHSSTGEVYSATQIFPGGIFSMGYWTPLPLPTGEQWANVAFQKYMQSKYSFAKPLIKILPDYLEDKDSIDVGNKIVPYQNGCFLLVQSKLDPAKFYVEREINLFGLIQRRYEPLEVNFNENLTKETPLWKAKVVSEQDYTIMNLSDNRFVIK